MATDDRGDSTNSNEQATSGLTAESVTALVNEVVNKAISARNKDVDKKFQATMTELMSKFEEKLKAVTPAPVSNPDEPKVEDSPVYKGMQKKFAELQEKFEQSEREKAEERNKARDIAMRQRVADELVKAGVDPSRTRHALALLVDSEKRVKYDDDGEIVFRDLDNQELDFATGLRSWAKSEDAKVFMPARGSTGSGDRRPASRKPASNNGSASLEDEIGESLLGALKDAGF